MKVRLLTSRAGFGFSQDIGDEIDLPQEEAVRLMKAGQAEPVRRGKAPENAARKPRAERAVK